MQKKDITILRELAKRVAEIADLPIMKERKEIWKRHHRLERVKPMLLVFPENSWHELIPSSVMQCDDQFARWIEWNLRTRLYYYDKIHDDTVIEKTYIVTKSIWNNGWGLESRFVPSSQNSGAGKYYPVIESADDLKKLKFPEVFYDEQNSIQRFDQTQEIIGDILDIKLKGIRTVSFHLMNLYTKLRGLDRVMIDMHEEPQMLHDAMSFIEEGHQRIIDQYIKLNLLSLNDDDTWIYPGGNGYSYELPQKDYDPEHIQPYNMWASAEAQELTLVSPEMHWEFALQYEKRLLERFGLTVYGCCEDLTRKLDYVFRISNLRQVNISPFADVDRCAENFPKNYIFSWKAHPSQLVGDFNTHQIRENINNALEATKGLVFEIVMKDTHTCENHPERFTIWTDIARNLTEKY
jgi:hypothetical protein